MDKQLRMEALLFNLQKLCKDLKRVADGLRVCTEIVTEQAEEEVDQYTFSFNDDVDMGRNPICHIRELW